MIVLLRLSTQICMSYSCLHPIIFFPVSTLHHYPTRLSILKNTIQILVMLTQFPAFNIIAPCFTAISCKISRVNICHYFEKRMLSVITLATSQRCSSKMAISFSLPALIRLNNVSLSVYSLSCYVDQMLSVTLLSFALLMGL